MKFNKRPAGRPTHDREYRPLEYAEWWGGPLTVRRRGAAHMSSYRGGPVADKGWLPTGLDGHRRPGDEDGSISSLEGGQVASKGPGLALRYIQH